MVKLDGSRRFIRDVLTNPINHAILERMPDLGLSDCWLTGGALFQTVWNVLDKRPPGTGINDYDIFYFDDSDTSYDAEDRAIRRAARVFGDLVVAIEVRNQARVHLWYEDHFGVPATPFSSSTDAIDHFVSTTCCLGIARRARAPFDVYAPFGLTDLYRQRIRPNPVQAARAVYEAKSGRWRQEWPRVVVDPWPRDGT